MTTDDKLSEICHCENETCANVHIEDEPAVYDFWFKGAYWGTVGFADTPADVIADVTMCAETPDEYGQWLVKDKFTKQKWTFTQFLTLHQVAV